MDLDIEKIVERQVKDEVDQLDIASIVEVHVRNFVAQSCGKPIKEHVESVAKGMIGVEISKALDGEVKTDDGWGKTQTHGSFEDFFRATLKSTLENKHGIQREIKQLVEQRVSALVKKDYEVVLEKIVDDLTKSKIVKKG